MIDFILSIFSKMVGMNLRDHHDIPFALPLLFFIFLSAVITMTVLHFIDVDDKEESE